MMNFDKHSGPCRHLLVLTCAAIISGCAGHAERDKPSTLSEFPQYSVEGYLPSKSQLDNLALLPPPPADGSAAFKLDEEYSRKSLALRGSPVWTLAILDADLTFPNAASRFSCALNVPVTEQDMPHLYRLLQRTLVDAGLSTKTAKKYYNRARPFLLNKEPICTPEDRERLEKSGSYPSGHNAAGTAWALILAEISPQQTEAILARGQSFGASRMICNVHWYSDTLQGRYMGAYTVARLHAEPKFRADLEAGKAEIEAVRAIGLKPTVDCKAEAAAMELQRSLDR